MDEAQLKNIYLAIAGLAAGIVVLAFWLLWLTDKIVLLKQQLHPQVGKSPRNPPMAHEETQP